MLEALRPTVAWSRRSCQALSWLCTSNDLSEDAQQKGIALTLSLRALSLRVLCDRERILRALGNLVGNALKFSERGGSVSLLSERAGGEAWFSLNDSGAGIAPAELAPIFERYWKGARTGKKGTGLGLYIVRRIVEAHGGRVWVDSEAGAGSTFTFALPLAS